MANNIIKQINGKYVKFYMTGKSYMPNVLANTGAATIVHKDNSINEFYIADEFISSGYGFYDKSYIDTSTYIIKSYDNVWSYINTINTSINTTYDNLYSYITNFKSDITARVLSGNSDLSNNYVIFDDKNGHTHNTYLTEFINIGPAHYESEVLDQYYVQYNYWFNGSSQKSVTSYNGERVSLPCYCRLDSILVGLNMSSNDTAGVTSIESYMTTYNIIGNTYSLPISVSYRTIISQAYYYNKMNIRVDDEEYQFNYPLINSSTSNSYIIVGPDQQSILSYINYTVGETPDEKYKKYVGTENWGNNFALYDKDNKIETHSHQIGEMPINTQMWAIVDTETTILNASSTTSSLFNKFKCILIDNDKLEIEISVSENEYTFFAIPIEYNVDVVTYLTEQKQRVNCTGDIQSFAPNINGEYEYKVLQIPNDNNEYKNVYIKFNVYCIKNTTKNKDTLYVKLMRNPEISSFVETTTTPISVSLSELKYNIQNEQYNNMYWLDHDYLTNFLESSKILN